MMISLINSIKNNMSLKLRFYINKDNDLKI